MCYHKANKATKIQLEDRYSATLRDVNFKPNDFEVGHEFGPGLIITKERPKELQTYNWGLIPYWCKDIDHAKQTRAKTLNCRSDEMLLLNDNGKPLKPSFYEAAKQAKRGIVPCTSFFDSHHITPGKTTTYKIPYRFYSEQTPIMSIAALYWSWDDPGTGEVFDTYTLLTVPANKMAAEIHNNNPRMISILSTKELERAWLYDELTEDDIQAICNSMPEDFLKAYPIYKQALNPNVPTSEKNNPDIIKPVEYDFEALRAADKPKEKKPKLKGDPGQGSLF